MKKLAILFRFAVVGLLLSSYPIASHAKAVDQVIVFGDSLSDNGNLHVATILMHARDHTVPILPPFPYNVGRFTNGLMWVEYLSKKIPHSRYHKMLYDYAIAGAWVEGYPYSHQNFPFDVSEQVYGYRGLHYFDKHKAKHLYVIWGGANDYLSGREDVDKATTHTIADIKEGIDGLRSAGANKFLLPNLPDLGRIPYATSKGPAFQQNLSALSRQHNQKLATLIAEERQAHPKDIIMTLDVFDSFNAIMANPAEYGLTNVTESCLPGNYPNAASIESLSGVKYLQGAGYNVKNPVISYVYRLAKQQSANSGFCSDPEHYLFWDRVHPTATIHKIIAERAYALLKTNHLA